MLAGVCGFSNPEAERFCSHIVQRCALFRIPVEVRLFSDMPSFWSGFAPGRYRGVYIGLGGSEGFQSARQLRERDRRVRIALVDDTKQYAIMAYRISVSDFLIRPISDARLNHSVDLMFR